MKRQEGQPVVIPCGSDQNSSYRKGCAGGPAAIRKALFSGAMNGWTEGGRELDFSNTIQWADGPKLRRARDPHNRIREAVHRWLEEGKVPVVLGGDHSVTWPVVQALTERERALDILHFDAHPDLYHAYDGNPLSHGSPFARIMESGGCARLVQVGIRGDTGHQREQARRFLVETIEMRNINPDLRLSFERPLYISVDLDVLEPGLSPGISHYEPGGLTVRQLIGILHRTEAVRIVGADIVEYNPRRDIHDMTAFVAVKLLKEILDKIFQVNGDPKTLSTAPGG